MNSKITVLKFGSSVLRDESDLSRVVHEIYSRWRRGSKVLAVVSAFGNTTDELLARANAVSDQPQARSVASLLATGEAAAAALLGLALDKAGIPVNVLRPDQAGFSTTGDILDAELVGANDVRLRDDLKNSVVVVSGFVGINEESEIALLGRGGSDLTAIFLAHRLRAECVLIKDVDGLYETDPNQSLSQPRRFRRANWQMVRNVGSDVVQEKAVKYAESVGLNFSITAIGSNVETEVYGGPSELIKSTGVFDQPLRIAILGCGTVGGGVFQALRKLPSTFEIVAVADRNPEKARAAGVPEKLFTSDPVEAIERNCDVVIELLGRTDPTRRYVERALKLGRHVVTANKALLSEHRDRLEAIAFEFAGSLSYSAAVGGVMPALEAVSNSAALKSFSGVVNGTCNFICDELARGESRENAIRAAQAAGFAESDPTLDISGRDSAQKLCLLAKAAFGIELREKDVSMKGINDLETSDVSAAIARGNVVRLVASFLRTDEGVEAKVEPVELPATHPFADLRGADNALLLEQNDESIRLIRGRGAGRWATTEAVVADLLDIRKRSRDLKPLAIARAAGREVYA
ncbi:MAG: hypothetical protein DMF63_01645 [Acidobacteria bacterium]|nr:MAG: hypothetical protein DMF63_01645 [Acidobacteriota bacterium]